MSVTEAPLPDERKVLIGSSAIRALGTPLIAGIGILNTGIIISAVGPSTYGLVSLIATVSLMLPFADLGLGAGVTTAMARARVVHGGQSAAIAVLKTSATLLSCVALLISLLAVLLGVTGSWTYLLGREISGSEAWAVSSCAVIFAVGIPLGLGVRVITGLGRHDISVAISMTASVGMICTTAALVAAQADGAIFALGSIVGPFLANATAYLIGLHILKRQQKVPTASRRTPPVRVSSLLGSAMWMLVITVGMAAGLQWGRLIVAHQSSAQDLAEFALSFQFYAMGWTVVSTAGAALWPMFARRREDRAETIHIWRKSVLIFSSIGLAGGTLLALLAPWAADLISSGKIAIDGGLAVSFGALVFVMSAHAPTGSLLTAPRELRFQAFCVLAMGIASVSLAFWLVPVLGPSAVPAGAAVAVLIFNFIPGMLFAPRFVGERASLSPSATND